MLAAVKAVPPKETTATPQTDVWLIEDHDDFRSMVSRMINHIPGLLCSKTFGGCEEALAALKQGAHPQVILSDIGLPGMNGIEGIRGIKALSPGIHIIMLTVHDDHEKIFEAICAGASGYLV
jgi:DNA-binding NarL/FixJ family response regulator